jgi:tetratricopeptide (TPR) repeat protein
MSPAMKAHLSAPTLALIVLAVMVALYGIDKFLAAQEQNEVDQEASSDFAAGKKLLAGGKAHQAVADFARAHALNRGNREYLLSLAEAQIADHQFAAAHDTLNDALEEDSNDGRANLLMARLIAANGKFKDADFYYHRAIYGEWPSNATQETAKARLELANMLAEHGNSQELLSELLLIQNQPDQSLATRKHIAALFLEAGSGQRAEAEYRGLIHEDRSDADIFVGLGQAHIMEGNYRAAENAFLDALRRRMNDRYIQSELGLVAKLATLDPTLRRLSTAEKYRRAGEILDLAQSELNACLPNPPKPEPAKPVRGAVTNEMAEARLDEAEKIWKQRLETCSQPPAPDDPLGFLMKKLAQ